MEKCLAVGFDEVVLLFLYRGTLGKVRQAVEARAEEKDRGRLHFMSPEEFFTFLDAAEPAAEETTVGGYRVKVRYRPAATRRSKAVSDILLKSLKKIKE